MGKFNDKFTEHSRLLNSLTQEVKEAKARESRYVAGATAVAGERSRQEEEVRRLVMVGWEREREREAW